VTKLNIFESETSFLIESKTCGYSKKKNIFYHFVESSYGLSFDKGEIMLTQIQAHNRLLKYTKDESDKKAVNKGLAELKLTLDMMHY
jgi:hypothetical protein